MRSDEQVRVDASSKNVDPSLGKEESLAVSDAIIKSSDCGRAVYESVL